MAISVKFQGLDAARDSILKLPEKLEKSVIRQMSQIAFDAAYRGADSHSRTGALTRSLYNRMIPKGKEVGHDPAIAPHALFVNMGTRPHKIRPNKKKALRWVGGGGRFVFAGEVNHPGYRGDAYLFRAADTAIRQFATIVENATKEAQ